MLQKVRNNTLKSPLYGNCRVQNPDGLHIFNCGHKKAQWYLKRNLAEIIETNPFVVRLKFAPNGQGHANDDFYLQERQNNCVCCGGVTDLTKHHVVPYCYRKFFPEYLKNHTAYDILPVCSSCHEKYEGFATEFKKQLVEEFSVHPKDATVLDVDLKNVCMAGTALLQHGSAIPPERSEYLMNILRKHYGENIISAEHLEEASKLKYNTHRENYKPESQSVVESLIDIEVFVKRWRKHFVEYAKPAFLPKYWNADRPLPVAPKL